MALYRCSSGSGGGTRVDIGTASLSSSDTTYINCGFRPSFILGLLRKDDAHFILNMFEFPTAKQVMLSVNNTTKNVYIDTVPPTTYGGTVGIIKSIDATGFEVNKGNTTMGYRFSYWAIE